MSQIKTYKRKVDEHFENKQYKQAIKSAEQVINLANKINDEILIDDQENLIDEAKARLRAESTLNKIREQKKVLNEKLYLLENNKSREKIIELHNYIEQFKNKYNEYLNLSALESVKKLVENAEKIWENYKAKVQEEKVHKNLLTKVDNLREKGMTALNNGSLKESFGHFEKIISLIGEQESE
jgi:tetratricopeptide (TPR) repeat protein